MIIQLDLQLLIAIAMLLLTAICAIGYGLCHYAYDKGWCAGHEQCRQEHVPIVLKAKVDGYNAAVEAVRAYPFVRPNIFDTANAILEAQAGIPSDDQMRTAMQFLRDNSIPTTAQAVEKFTT